MGRLCTSDMDALTSTELGSLPSDWRVQRFDSLFAVQQGKQVSKKNRVGENQRPFLRTKNVFWGRLDLTNLDEMHFTETDEKRLVLQPDDLLVCEGGDIGRTAIWRGELARCYYQNHLHRARVRDEAANSEFALYWLWYAFEIGSVYFGRGNVTTIPNLSQSKLCELPLPVPPLPEQRKIAGVLGVVQRAIEQQERLLQLTAELKKTLLHQLFTQGLRGEPQKQTEIGPVPESWDVVRLRDLCDPIVDCPHTTPKFQAEGIRVARNFNVRDGRFVTSPAFYTSREEYLQRIKRAEPLPGDILFSREAPVGEACVIPHRMKLSLGQRTMLLRAREGILDAQFMVYCFYAPNVRRRMLASSSGLTVPHLNVADVRDLLVPIPPLCDQQQIATAILTVDNKAECHRKNHAALTALFRTLLHQLMTAQLRVNNFDTLI